MDKQTVLVGAVLLALVAGFSGGYAARGSQMPQPMVHNMGTAMSGMTAALEDKTGDAFDQAFLSEMIVHHEGAVEMAQAALQRAKHQELKDMAQAIISAQTAEISQMKAWAKEWYNQ